LNNPLSDILARSRQLYSQADIQQAIVNLAAAITRDLGQQDIVMLCVMKGGVPITAALMQELSMPIKLDYIHATRYGNKLTGGEIQWLALPQTDLNAQTVLVVDDIFDEGQTLKAIVDYSYEQGASLVKSAVLVEKKHNRKATAFNVDYIGLTVPDQYVFGFGMDCEGWGRNLREIYSLEPDN